MVCGESGILMFSYGSTRPWRIMPLVKGKAAKSKEGFSENVRREVEARKPQKQAVAIAYSEARGGKKRKKK
jgi:hypothetical protein